MKVLIVDDYLDYAITGRDRFEIEGYEAEYCLYSTEAVEMALNYKPDWVVLDIRMPEKSGVTVYNELNERADFEFSAVFYSNFSKDPDILAELEEAKVPNDVIFKKTSDPAHDIKNRLIPALKAGLLKGGKISGKE